MTSWAELLTCAEAGEHVVQLYGGDDRLLAKNVSRYLAEGLRRGDGLVVIATPEHTAAIARHLVDDTGAAADEALRAGRLVYLDAAETLGRLRQVDRLDPAVFDEVLGGVMRQARAGSGSGKVRVFGEMVGLLWHEGHRAEAGRLEELWAEGVGGSGCSLYCAYPIDLFGGGEPAELSPIVGAHDHVLAGSGTLLTSGRARG